MTTFVLSLVEFDAPNNAQAQHYEIYSFSKTSDYTIVKVCTVLFQFCSENKKSKLLIRTKV